MKLLTENPWKLLTHAVRNAPAKCRVAVAYFGKGASKLLPLQEGSVLVVDWRYAKITTGRWTNGSSHPVPMETTSQP